MVKMGSTILIWPGVGLVIPKAQSEKKKKKKIRFSPLGVVQPPSKLALGVAKPTPWPNGGSRPPPCGSKAPLQFNFIFLKKKKP
jgi:hypothetical protein